MITNALAAVAVGQQMGLSDEEIVQGIAAFRPVDGHGSVFATEHFTIMDDCYNANPVSMQAGVRLLSEVPERKVAILGDMFELGAEEEKLHYETEDMWLDAVWIRSYALERWQNNILPELRMSILLPM